jgi:D-serine deaminase-like pyridoxal phosphate-dependent protein
MSAASLVGQGLDALDTPALLVDLDRLEANIAHIAETCRAAGVAWRPHIKGQKAPALAALEQAAGARGITCAKLGEAEAMADAGLRDILIANQVVGPLKLARLAALARRCALIVAVDDPGNIAAMGEAAAAAGSRLGVIAEVNIGMNRAGVEPGAPVLALAEAAARQPALTFRGVMGWESHAVAIADPAEKERTVAAALAVLVECAALCRRAGHHQATIVSCGGTGTFPYCARQPGVTEVQVGGGVFSDVHYRQDYHYDRPQALTLLATVTSRPTPTRLVLDAGRKALSCDTAMPEPLGLPQPMARPLRLSAEHGTIELAAPSATPRVGDRVELLVGYGDTTVHLHEELVAVRRGRIEAVWPVTARGRLK